MHHQATNWQLISWPIRWPLWSSIIVKPVNEAPFIIRQLTLCIHHAADSLLSNLIIFLRNDESLVSWFRIIVILCCLVVSGFVLSFDFHAISLCPLSVSSMFFPLSSPLPPCMFVSPCLSALFPPCVLLCAFPSLSHLSSSLLSLLTCSSSPHQCVCVFKPLFPIHSLSVHSVWLPVMYPVSPPVSSLLVCFGFLVSYFAFMDLNFVELVLLHFV